jgi:hypothetical protein
MIIFSTSQVFHVLLCPQGMGVIQTCNMSKENPFDYLGWPFRKTHPRSQQIPQNGCPGISGTPYPVQIKNSFRCLDAMLNTVWYHPLKN